MSRRLSQQGTMLLICTHPSISIWLSHLGGQLSKSVQLDGLDVSFDATPPKGLLPDNIRLFNWDIRQPAPAELIGVYDIVHIRNFSFVLQEDEIEPIIGHLIDLLSMKLLPLVFPHCRFEHFATVAKDHQELI